MSTTAKLREQITAGIAITERRYELAGTSTAVWEGGDGPPLVLLHGPGEFAGTWLPVLPRLLRTNRVVVPDLPGHGATATPADTFDADRVLGWLGELIERTCPTAPALVGRVVGGAIAARYALLRPADATHLVLVDTTGLTAFDPDPRFGLAIERFATQPTPETYLRAMDFCAFDLDSARRRFGDRWDPFARYVVELLRTGGVAAAMNSMLMWFAGTPIPPERLARIAVPTTLIWGRHDLATPLRVAEAAADSYGWPLHVIDGAGDDPGLDQPDAFVDALRAALDVPVGSAAAS